MDDLGVPLFFGNTHILNSSHDLSLQFSRKKTQTRPLFKKHHQTHPSTETFPKLNQIQKKTSQCNLPSRELTYPDRSPFKGTFKADFPVSQVGCLLVP